MLSPVMRISRRLLSTASAEAIKKTHLNAWHVGKQARMVEFGGWDMPVVYKDQNIITSHLWTRQHVSLFDVSHMLQLEFRGRDRIDFLESLTVADIRGLGDNRSCLSMFTNDKGTIIDDTMITKNPDHLYVVVNAGCADKDLLHLNTQLAKWKKNGKDVTMTSLRDERSLVALQGPEAAAVLAKAIDGGNGAALVKAAPFLSSFSASVFGRKAYISRCGYTGEDGFEVSVSHKDVVHVADGFVGNGDAVKPAGLGARDTLRLEAGLCLYGNDIDDTTSPIEASLTWCVAAARRNPAHPNRFPGWERITAEIKGDSVTRKRVGILVPESRRPPPHPTDVFNADGKVVGRVTSGSSSPVLDKGIGMAYIDKPHHVKGTRLHVLIRGNKVDVVVTPLPFVPTSYYKM